MSGFAIEKDWITKSGLRAVAGVVRESHRCGYVGVPKTHKLYGKDYGHSLDKEHWECLESNKETFKGSPIDILLAAYERNDGEVGPRLSYFVNVHGGLTYAGGKDNYPAVGDEWWFGFDCAHLGDARMNDDRPSYGDAVRSLAYVEEECEALAEQLARLA